MYVNLDAVDNLVPYFEKNDESYGYLDVEVAGDKAVLTFRVTGGEPLYTRDIGR